MTKDTYHQELSKYIDSVKPLLYEHINIPKTLILPDFVSMIAKYEGEAYQLSNEARIDKFTQNTFISRVSQRIFSDIPLELSQISDILKYGYGVHDSLLEAYGIKNFHRRMAPSSGGLQSIETFVFINNCVDLPKGFYYFSAVKNQLILISDLYSPSIFDDLTFNDKNVSKSGMVICLVGFIDKLYWKYKKNAIRQCMLDCGFVSENFYLLANALNLNIYSMGGFQENTLSEMFDFEKWQIPLLLMPIGNK